MTSRNSSRTLSERYRCFLKDFHIPDWPEGIDSVPGIWDDQANREASFGKDIEYGVLNDNKK